MKSLILPEIQEMVQNGEYTVLAEILRDMHAKDSADILKEFPPEEIMNVLEALGNSTAIETFEFLDISIQKDILEKIDKQRVTKFIEEMSPDDRVDILKHVDREVSESFMPFLAQAERNDIRKLSQYREGTAGAIMTTEYAFLNQDLTANEALTNLRLQAPDTETIYYIYVVDKDRKLLGFVSLKKIIVSRHNQRLHDIMDTNVISVDVDTDVEVVSDLIAKYDFLAIPVVNKENKLLGIVTVDDALDSVVDEATKDIYQMGAAGTEIDYMNTGVLKISRQRLIWLILLIGTGFISGFIMELYQDLLTSIVALTFFIPLLSGSGGNAGTQASTVIIRGLATGEVLLKDAMRLMGKEILIGVTIGVCMGLLGSIRAFILQKNPMLGITVGVAMIVTIITANAIGAILPFLLKLVKLDPAIMSAPLVSSLLDIISISIYLSLGYLWMG